MPGLVGVIIAAAAFQMTLAQPAGATTWGHLRSPFSAESEQLERANFAAEERAIRRERDSGSTGFWTASCAPANRARSASFAR
jgi:hypothetical protein